MSSAGLSNEPIPLPDRARFVSALAMQAVNDGLYVVLKLGLASGDTFTVAMNSEMISSLADGVVTARAATGLPMASATLPTLPFAENDLMDGHPDGYRIVVDARFDTYADVIILRLQCDRGADEDVVVAYAAALSFAEQVRHAQRSGVIRDTRRLHMPSGEKH